MRFPSKVRPYELSTIAAFPIILEKVETSDVTPKKLYQSTRKHFVGGIPEFIETLDYLYALGKIELSPEGLIHYVA